MAIKYIQRYKKTKIHIQYQSNDKVNSLQKKHDLEMKKGSVTMETIYKHKD